jgi:hypothetical protein
VAGQAAGRQTRVCPAILRTPEISLSFGLTSILGHTSTSTFHFFFALTRSPSNLHQCTIEPTQSFLPQHSPSLLHDRDPLAINGVGNTASSMSNQFIGLTMLVTLSSPPGAQLRGVVNSIEPGKSLTLRNGKPFSSSSVQDPF